MTQEEYATKTKQCQEWPTLWRFRYSGGYWYFEVYWGEWRILGTEFPQQYAIWHWDYVSELRVSLSMSASVSRGKA